MLPAIEEVSYTPATTLSFDNIVYFGQNQIRRNVGKSTSLYIGDSVIDSVVKVPPLSLSTVSVPNNTILAISIVTDNPVTVVVDSTVTIDVNKTLVMDHPFSSMVIHNDSTSLSANMKISYIYVASSA